MTRNLVGVVVGSVALASAVAGCGSGGGSSASSAHGVMSTSTTGAATSSAGTSVPGGDAPIGSAGITMGSGSSRSYPPNMVSQDLAKDCYHGGDRIYDRYGITCSDATRVLAAYEKTSASSSGGQQTVEKYKCSHNPDIMVNQGAAPGKCIDGSGNVVFNWRYPGAPLPAKG